MPVFTDPYQVCSCHGEPWPCDDAWAESQRQLAARREEQRAAYCCAACGQERNLGPLRYGSHAVAARRYCRRVGCVREAQRWQRELHNARERENTERQAFAAQMQVALAPDHATKGRGRASEADLSRRRL